MSESQFWADIEGQDANHFMTKEVVDWGSRPRGQGRRFGTMIRGAMSDMPVGKKTYLKFLGKLPKEEHDEAYGLQEFAQKDYSKARAFGLNHDQAMIVGYVAEKEISRSEAYKLIQEHN